MWLLVLFPFGTTLVLVALLNGPLDIGINGIGIFWTVMATVALTALWRIVRAVEAIRDRP